MAFCTFGNTSSDTALKKQDSGSLCSIFRKSVGTFILGTKLLQHWGNEQPGHSELLDSVTQGRFVCRQEVWILSQLKGKLRIIRRGGLKFSIWSSYSLFSVPLRRTSHLSPLVNLQITVGMSSQYIGFSRELRLWVRVGPGR